MESWCLWVLLCALELNPLQKVDTDIWDIVRNECLLCSLSTCVNNNWPAILILGKERRVYVKFYSQWQFTFKWFQSTIKNNHKKYIRERKKNQLKGIKGELVLVKLIFKRMVIIIFCDCNRVDNLCMWLIFYNDLY